LRWKYSYRRKYITATGCLNAILPKSSQTLKKIVKEKENNTSH
jgi:hypothetical protein